MNTGIPGRQDVIDLALKGIRPADIETRTGLSINTIYCDISAGRKMGFDIPHFNRGRPRNSKNKVRATVNVPKSLGAHASLRQITIPLLAEMLLARISDDNLVDAILDDGESNGG